MSKTLTPLQKLDRYTVEIIPITLEDGGGSKATYKETGISLAGRGVTSAEALAELREMAEDVIAMEDPDDVWPDPSEAPAWEDFSGRVTLRLPLKLHFDLDALAEAQGVSLNTLLVTMLAEGAGRAHPSPNPALHDVESLAESLANLLAAKLEPAIAREVEKRVFVDISAEPDPWHTSEWNNPLRMDDYAWNRIGEITTPVALGSR